jgi:hypothetical protein
MVPVEPDVNGGKPVEGVERIEPSAVGLENMLKVADEFFNAQMRRFICGPDAPMRPTSTGLGSSVGDIQNDAFFRIVKFDCADLEQTLTHQLVAVLQEWNHPGTSDQFECKYIVDCDRPDAKLQLEAIKIAWDMGVSFDEGELRSVCGMSTPSMDSKTVQKSAAEMNPFQPPGLEDDELKPEDEGGVERHDEDTEGNPGKM